jgi:hypothetical protein
MIAAIATIFTLLIFQAPGVSLPKFEDFPGKERFAGVPARPTLSNPRQRLFRTRIREAAQKGANSAGHYTIVEWGLRLFVCLDRDHRRE